MIKLNLGSGDKPLDGYINIDLPEIDLEEAKLPYDDNVVDEVYMRHVLEHINNRENLVREIYRVLKPNGMFVCILPVNSSNISHKSYRHFKSYFNTFTTDAPEYKSLKSGYFVVERFSIGLSPFKGVVYKFIEWFRSLFAAEYKWEMKKIKQS